MIPPLRFLFSLFLALTFTSSFLSAEEEKVAKVDITIHHATPAQADEGQVRSLLQTQVGNPFSQELFDKDIKKLAEDFVRVEPKLETLGGEVFLSLELWPKPLIRVIEWQGNEKLSTKKLQAELKMGRDSVFDPKKFNEAFQKVKRYYVKKGFFEAELGYNVQPNDVTNEVDITIHIKEGRSGRVRQISFSGLSRKEESEILDQMVVKKYRFFLSWATGSGSFNHESLEQDQYSILSYLQNRGYANAKVEVKVKELTSKNRVDIQVMAEKGPLFRIGSLHLEGNTLFDETTLRNLLSIYPEANYSPEKIRQSVRNIVDYYGARGYIDAVVNYRPHLVPKENVYNIDFQISEGKPYRVGLIKIFGNTTTQSRVILHETLLVPGETFDTRKLKKSEERLRNVGYFKTVNVYPARGTEENSLGENFRDVHIEVEEMSTGSLSFFFGYSTLSNVFAGIDITERNFNYKGLSRVFKEGPLAVRGGGEMAHLRTNIGRRMRSYMLSWTQPYFYDTPWSVGFDVERTINRQQSRDYHIKSLGFSVHAQYPINEFLRFGWHYRMRDSDVTVTAESPSMQMREEAENSGLISGTGVGLYYNSTDHPVEPRKGFRSSLAAEFVGIGGDFNFLNMSYLNTYYAPLSKKGVMKYRADLRFIQTYGSTAPAKLPLDERLYLGGEASVRGYRPYIIGPKFSDGDPRGGVSSALLSLEYRYKLWNPLDAFVFYDAGAVSLEEFHINTFRISYGLGFSLKVMRNIPITFGLGFPVNEEDRGDVRRFFLSIGMNF